VPLWTNFYNGAGNSDDEATSLALDGTGNVYVTGYSDSGTSYDYATIKYSSAGVPLWTNIYNGAGNGTDEALSLAVDGTGTVYVTGESVGIGSGFDYATIKYSSAGVPLWTNTYNGAGNSTDEALSIAVDGSGNVYVTGESTGSGIGFDYATIRYAGPPNATVITPPASATVALSSNATFTATAGGFQPLAVQWQFNGNAIAGATNNSLTISNAGFAAAGSYQVIVSNTFGSATSAVAVLTVTGNLALDTFDPSPYGNGFYFGGDATNVSVGIVPGVGLGGTAALRARCDFNNGPNGYGFLAAQWQDGAVIGNVDTNLSHYRLAFDAYVTGDAQHQSGGGFTLVLQETAGTNFSTPFPQGTLQTYQPYQGGADLMVSHSGTWQHFDINLGGPAFMGTNGFNDNFSPTGATWQIGFQLNASDWGAEPQTGTTLIIDNLALKLGAPPVAVTESNTGFTNGQFGFNLNGVAGTWVVIQASSNLFNWTPFQTSTFGGDPLQFRDPQPAGFRMRFYRAVLLP
jgi:hypothetical protein